MHESDGDHECENGNRDTAVRELNGGKTAESGHPPISHPSSPTTNPVLYKDVNVASSRTPKRCFLDDLDEFERLLVGGIPGRHQRLRMHGVVMNAARMLGWLPKAEAASESWGTAKERLLRTWQTIMEKTSPGNVGVATDEAVADFAKNIDASLKGGKMASFKPRMPDFRSLPELGDAGIEGTRRRLLALMDAGILPSPGGNPRVKQNIATGATRIITELLWPLAKTVPQQCLDGIASLSAAKMRALCPSRRHTPVVRWLAEANILRVTREDYARWDPSLGRGRTRLWFVNLPLLAWLAGVGKESLSWTAGKASGCPTVAPGVAGKARRTAPGSEPA